MENFDFWHRINIIVHVTCGIISLCIGIVAMTTVKGGNTHRKSGRLFVSLLAIVVITGLFGVFLFKVNQFLLVITVLSGYNAYSGIRVLRNKDNRFNLQDVSVAILTVSTGIYFVYYIKRIGFFWSPVVVYSTLGALFFIISYDLIRYAIPPRKYGNLWLYEHIYKMIAAFTALLSAAVGTIYEEYQPHSQYLPSVVGLVLALSFILYFYRKNRVPPN